MIYSLPSESSFTIDSSRHRRCTHRRKILQEPREIKLLLRRRRERPVRRLRDVSGAQRAASETVGVELSVKRHRGVREVRRRVSTVRARARRRVVSNILRNDSRLEGVIRRVPYCVLKRMDGD